MVNIGSLSSGAQVIAAKADLAKIRLNTPVCTTIGEKIALKSKSEKTLATYWMGTNSKWIESGTNHGIIVKPKK